MRPRNVLFATISVWALLVSDALSCVMWPPGIPPACVVPITGTSPVLFEGRIKGYTTFGSSSGQNCACGLGSFDAAFASQIVSIRIVYAGTNTAVPGFGAFATNATVATQFKALGPSGKSWAGFLATTTAAIPAGIHVDVVITASRTGNYAKNRDQFEKALTQSCIGTDEATSTGKLTGKHQKLNKLNLRSICAGFFDSAVFDNRVSTGGPNLRLAIKNRLAATRAIFGVEVFTGERTGPAVLQIWSHDTSNNRPGSMLRTGSYAQQLPNSWQGVNLNSPVTIAANTDFWVVWGMPSGSQSPVEGRGGPGIQQYRGSFNNGPWNGPFQSFRWKIRLYCYPRKRGSFLTYGNPCPGTNRTLPTIGYAGMPPTVGMNAEITLRRARPSTAAIMMLGLQKLAVDLTGARAPGCFLYTAPISLTSTATGASGSASLLLPIPDAGALACAHVYFQWIVFDPGANGLQLVFSAGGDMLIGLP